MSNGTKKNIEIIIPSSLDDEGARMLVIPLLREPVLMQDVYQPDQVMKLLRISKPRFYELTDLKQRNPLPTHNYGPGKRGTIILREELVEWITSLPKGIGNGKPGEPHEDVYCQALADKIGVMISTLSAFCVPTAFPTSEICQA